MQVQPNYRLVYCYLDAIDEKTYLFSMAVQNHTSVILYRFSCIVLFYAPELLHYLCFAIHSHFGGRLIIAQPEHRYSLQDGLFAAAGT